MDSFLKVALSLLIAVTIVFTGAFTGLFLDLITLTLQALGIIAVLIFIVAFCIYDYLDHRKQHK